MVRINLYEKKLKKLNKKKNGKKMEKIILL